MEYLKSPKNTVISISTGTIVKVLLILLGLVLLWQLRDILAMFFAAVLIASLIEPFAAWLAARRIPRGLAVLAIYLLLLAVIGTVFVPLIPIVIDQVLELLRNFSTKYPSFIDSFVTLKKYSVQYGFEQSLRSTIDSVQNGLTASFGSVFATVKGLAGSVLAIVVVFVLTFYLVVEENATKKFLRQIIPAEYQPFAFQLFGKIQKKIGAWMRGQLIMGLIVGLAVYLGLALIGVQYALLVAILAALFEIVPYIGPWLSFVPAVVLGFSASPLQGVLVVILFFFIQQSEHHILVPKIMQKITGLNPVISIIALLIGVKFGGLVGALLAIPVASMVVLIIEEFFQTNQLNDN
jgi:predicted PurR-regulated permease PerM